MKKTITVERDYVASYGVFCVFRLLQSHGINGECDYQIWKDSVKIYEDFLDSSFNDHNESEYECLHFYFKYILKL